MFGETYRTDIFKYEGLAGIGSNNVLLKMISDLGAYQRLENPRLRDELVPFYKSLTQHLDLTSTELALYPQTQSWNSSMLVGVAAYWADHAHARQTIGNHDTYLLPANYMQQMSENIQLSLAGRRQSENVRTAHRYLTNICVAANLLPRELRLNGQERYSTPDPFRGVYGRRHAA